LMTTFLARRSQFHHNHLVARVTPYDLTTQQMFQQFRQYFISIGSDAATATQRAWMALDGMVERHAAMLAFVEAFWVNALIFMVMIPFAAMLANPHTRRAKAATRSTDGNKGAVSGTSVEQPEEVPELMLH
jgi:DHA2 family multidrug resistance protein